jgi:hypothetical protein
LQGRDSVRQLRDFSGRNTVVVFGKAISPAGTAFLFSGTRFFRQRQRRDLQFRDSVSICRTAAEKVGTFDASSHLCLNESRKRSGP